MQFNANSVAWNILRVAILGFWMPIHMFIEGLYVFLEQEYFSDYLEGIR